MADQETWWSLSPDHQVDHGFILQSWQLFVVILAGWMNRQQQEVIEYFRTENLVLQEKRGRRRILLDDGQRRSRSLTPGAPS
jgi:hypothetical protein